MVQGVGGSGESVSVCARKRPQRINRTTFAAAEAEIPTPAACRLLVLHCERPGRGVLSNGEDLASTGISQPAGVPLTAGVGAASNCCWAGEARGIC